MTLCPLSPKTGLPPNKDLMGENLESDFKKGSSFEEMISSAEESPFKRRASVLRYYANCQFNLVEIIESKEKNAQQPSTVLVEEGEQQQAPSLQI